MKHLKIYENIDNKLGTFQYSSVPSYYDGITKFPYDQTSWITSVAYNNGSDLVVGSVVGSLTTGNTISIGGGVYGNETNNILNFRTIKSKTPDVIALSIDESFVYVSGKTGDSAGATNGLSLTGKNIKLGGTLTGNTIISGNNSNSLSFNSLSAFNLSFGSATITDNGTAGSLKYAADYSPNYTNRSIPDVEYVNAVAAGLKPIEAVRVATTGILVYPYSGLTIIDGVHLSNGDRVLVKNQDTVPQANGVWVVNYGIWTRAADFDGTPVGETLSGTYMWVLDGVTNIASAWVLITPDPILIGTTPLNFAYYNHASDVTSAIDSGIVITNSSGKTYVALDGVAKDVRLYGITGATNGLNLQGRNVRLGGVLTGNTNITGNYNLNICNGAQLNTILGYQISGCTILRTAPNTISSVYLGCGSGNNTSTGLNNFAVGCQALYSNTTGDNNIAVGSYALASNTCGNSNIANGYQALSNNSYGAGNIGIGHQALMNNTGGTQNIGVGHNALSNNISGDLNVAIGAYSLYYNTCGCENVSQGYGTLLNNTYGNSNVGIGNGSLRANVSGSGNIAIGTGAKSNGISGCNNTIIGIASGYLNLTGSSNIFIGACSGYNEMSSNKLYVANTCTNQPLIYGDFVTKCAIVHGAFKTSGTTSLLVAPVTGTTTDDVLIWNSVDKNIKRISPNVGNVCNVSSPYVTKGSDSFIGVCVASVIDLYATPALGQTITVTDIGACANINPITICSSLGINGNPYATINTDFGSMTFKFNGSFYSIIAMV